MTKFDGHRLNAVFVRELLNSARAVCASPHPSPGLTGVKSTITVLKTGLDNNNDKTNRKLTAETETTYILVIPVVFTSSTNASGSIVFMGLSFNILDR